MSETEHRTRLKATTATVDTDAKTTVDTAAIRASLTEGCLTGAQLAEAFGCGERQIRHYAICGMPFRQIGKRRYYKLDHVIAWLDRRNTRGRWGRTPTVETIETEATGKPEPATTPTRAPRRRAATPEPRPVGRPAKATEPMTT
jgi:hypothetical protein